MSREAGRPDFAIERRCASPPRQEVRARDATKQSSALAVRSFFGSGAGYLRLTIGVMGKIVVGHVASILTAARPADVRRNGTLRSYPVSNEPKRTCNHETNITDTW
jgi:hypothetical protein